MKTSFQNKCRWIFNIAVLVALTLNMVPAQSSQAMDPPYQTYLPLITSPFTGISGRVMLNGTSAVGEQIFLCYLHGSSCPLQYFTGFDGSYYFDANLLTLGAEYFILYSNTHNESGKLSEWISEGLAPYVINSRIVISTFDISDVLLISPISGATVCLPLIFQWSKRSASPTDSYKLLLFNDLWWTGYSSSLLGYEDRFQLTSLPAGFSSNTAYNWTVEVFSPEGGYGHSLSKNTVTFLNSGNSMSESQNGIDYTHQLVDGKDFLFPSITP
jgi:hypothetical protein